MMTAFEPVLLVSSRCDPAGSLIHEEIDRLLREQPDKNSRFIHHRVDKRLIYLENDDLPYTASCILFLSRHSSREHRPVLTVHVSGNYGTAELGGDPGTLTPAAVPMMHAILTLMSRHAPDGYAVTYEVTHHGPTGLTLPSCFVELGSSEREWHDRDAAAAVARAVIDAVPTDVIRLAGFGGTHYAQRQTEVTLTTRGGFGHIMPTRDFSSLIPGRFLDMIRMNQAQGIYIDRKALNKDQILQINTFAEENGIPVLGMGDLIVLNRMDLSRYLAIRTLAEGQVPGSTITVHEPPAGTDLDIITIPADLLEETIKTNQEEFFEGIHRMEVVSLAGGGQACLPVFITDQSKAVAISDDLIRLCVSILIRNHSCRMDGNTLLLCKNRFDPDKARSFGIPPGPLYGELMAGREIMVDGKVISPDMVMTPAEKSIQIPRWGR